MNRDRRCWPGVAQPCTTKESSRAREPGNDRPAHRVLRRRGGEGTPAYYAEDITLTFANNPTVTGRVSALAAISEMPNRSGRCTPTWSTYERRRRRHLRVRRYLALFTAAARSQSKPARCSLCWTASSPISGSTSQRPVLRARMTRTKASVAVNFITREAQRLPSTGMAWTR